MFTFLPIEAVIHTYQHQYCRALHDSTQAGSSTVFIEFMPAAIRSALAEKQTDRLTEQATEGEGRIGVSI